MFFSSRVFSSRFEILHDEFKKTLESEKSSRISGSGFRSCAQRTCYHVFQSDFATGAPGALGPRRHQTSLPRFFCRIQGLS